MKHFVLVAVLSSLALSCAQSAQKGAPSKATKEDPKAEVQEVSPVGESTAPSTAPEVATPKTKTSTTDALSGLSPEVIASLTPKQIEAIRALGHDKLKKMKPEELQALLDANRGEDSQATLTIDQKTAILSGLLGVVGAAIQRSPHLGEDDEFEDDCDDCDEEF